MYNFFFHEVPEHLPFLLQGALVTIELSLISMALGMVLGFCVAVGRMAASRLVRWPLDAVVEVVRDTPLIVQLLLIYFALPEIGIVLNAFWAGIAGLTLNLAAYLSEVFRAAILAVDSGQRQAAVSLGMSRIAVYRRVIIPQAALASLPTLGGYFIALLKDCSLVSFISVNELLRHATIVISDTFDSMNTYIMVAIIYFIMSFASARVIRYIELRLTPSDRRQTISVPLTMDKEGAR
ncbi:amino acid ABC transporter permease [Acetobacter sp. TBRC 12305]|uniref:Amino acid ABC transporter permease n=1 Tax=Acetobacter garciniae TaxID=2817435 RepID=A0A939HNX9_9PROT|nr:amino acid ABC transporter permease [Acetobacter garciniae]MBO1324514.1 amino acid ABC transporter permease [Acetobacter garciniae]MBX0344203.1 amino acid ABC transporter permease [Acetobacter garciniae]